jgi:hypothetical protein
MATVITIDGTPVLIKAKSLRIQAANGRTTASFTVESLDASYRPDLDAEALLVEDGTRILGAVVTNAREKGTAGGARAALTTDITVADFNAFVERRIISISIPGGTLKAALELLRTTYLSGPGGYDITLDAGQVDGPTLPALAYTVKGLREVLDDIMTLTADFGEPFAWRINDFRVLSAKQPSDNPAPFNLSGLPIPQVIGDIVVETKRDSNYANNVTVYVPPTPQTNRVETFEGDGIEDTFTLEARLTGHRGFVVVNGAQERLTEEGSGFELAVQWIWDPDDNTIRRVAQGVSDPPADEAVISITFDGILTIVVNEFNQDQIDEFGIKDYVLTLTSIPPDTTASAIAAAELAKRAFVTRTVTYRTLESGLAIGQSQSFTVPRRNLSVTGLITQISTRDFGKDRLEREVTVTIDGSQTNLGKTWGDVYRRWNGTGAASPAATSVVGSGPTPQIGPGGPATAVQYNADGTLGGTSRFTYDPETDSIVMGLLSSIPATHPQSCAAIGYDCHIEDPA